MSIHHIGPIAGITAHGQWIATAGYDNRLILWDSTTREAVQQFHHDHLVNQCAFSPDGNWLVSASSDYTARVWSLKEMKLVSVLDGHTDDVDMAAFSPDGNLVATCALDRCVRIFERTGRCLHTLRGHTGNVLSLAWSHDNASLVSSSVDGTIRTWDSVSGAQLALTDLGMRSDSVEIADNEVIYAADDYGRIATIAQDNCLEWTDAHAAGIKKIALNAAQNLLVSLSYDRTLAVWQIEPSEQSTGAVLNLLQRCELPPSIWARAATFVADGRIACGTFGGTYALYDVATGQWDLQGVDAGNAINAVLHSGNAIYTVGDSGEVLRNGQVHARMHSLCNFLVDCAGHLYTGGQLGQVFDANSGEILYQHTSPLNCAVALAHQGTPHLAQMEHRAHLIIGTYTGEILVFAVMPDASLQLEHTLRVYENAVKGLSVSHETLFSVCANTDVAWHAIDSWQLLRRVERAHERIANACCAIDADGFASVGRDRTLRLWHGDSAARYETPHAHSVKCIAVDANRTAVLTGSYGGTVARFDLKARRWGALQRVCKAGISAISWNTTTQQFLAASYDGNVYALSSGGAL